MTNTVNEKARVWWKGMLGTVLAKGGSSYYVVFGDHCQFVPISECTVIIGKKQ